MKPLIGINGNWASDGSSSPLISVRENYVKAVAGAGGVPLVLPLVEDPVLISLQVAACDGFVFVGGADLDPSRYGEEPHPLNGALAPCRECYDFALIQEIIRLEKPFLAICLGCQEVNVALGGTLIQDIGSELDSEIRHSMKQAPFLSRHDVTVEPGTLLGNLLGDPGSISTNSAHHQAARHLGERLRLSARCADGVVEAFELTDYPFGLGIQWHPEYLQHEDAHRTLFHGVVAAASRSAQALAGATSGEPRSVVQA